jgi:hypothetical protein
MKRFALALIAFGVGACAHEEARPVAANPCNIAQVDWPSAEKDYSLPGTAATLDRLNQIVRADRDRFRADPTGSQLGRDLGPLTAEVKTGPFVAKSAAEAATRLRQLECAIQRGTFAGRTADADHLYGDILTDVAHELSLAKK